jgi:carboxyl-terminal processing protease
MKKVFLILTVLFFQTSFSQAALSKTQETADFVQIWGLLKYQHPEISKGKFDFNEEFIKEFEIIEAIDDKSKRNEELMRWIAKFESAKTKYKTDASFLKDKSLFDKNADFGWIKNPDFSPELQAMLLKIKDNVAYGDYYASINGTTDMVEFKNEKGYNQFDSAKKSHRMLFLASFWNAMRYWNVNIYLTDTPWTNVLSEMIPEFLEGDATKFGLAKDKLISRLNDSHADYEANYSLKNTFSKYPVFSGKIVNDSLVVTKLNNKNLAAKDQVDLGDVIYSVKGKPLKNYISDTFSDVISASTQGFLRHRIVPYFVLAGSSDSIKVGIRKKDGSQREIFISLRKFSDYKYEPVALDMPKLENWNKLTDNIGYLNLAVITKDELKEAFRAFENTKGIVIDLRNYPRNISVSDLPKYLYPEKKTFIKVLDPLLPAYGQYDVRSGVGVLVNPFSAGSGNKNYYKGRIVLLVNRSTQSNAEFIGMAIQQSPNCITIGEQTSAR